MHPLHAAWLKELRSRYGAPEQDAFLGHYLGNPHPRFAVKTPELRQMVRTGFRSHPTMTASEFGKLVTGLIKGATSTEKFMAGYLLDYSKPIHQTFPVSVIAAWPAHLIGWAEVDVIFTSQFTATAVPEQWEAFRSLTTRWSKSKSIHTRRAALVIFCKSLSKTKDADILSHALKLILHLSDEKEVMITKAISWVLRSAAEQQAPTVRQFLKEYGDRLPALAVRETMTLLRTGRKTKPKSK